MEVVTLELGIIDTQEFAKQEADQGPIWPCFKFHLLDHKNAKIACSLSLIVPAVLLQTVVLC